MLPFREKKNTFAFPFHFLIWNIICSKTWLHRYYKRNNSRYLWKYNETCLKLNLLVTSVFRTIRCLYRILFYSGFRMNLLVTSVFRTVRCLYRILFYSGFRLCTFYCIIIQSVKFKFKTSYLWTIFQLSFKTIVFRKDLLKELCPSNM